MPNPENLLAREALGVAVAAVTTTTTTMMISTLMFWTQTIGTVPMTRGSCVEAHSLSRVVVVVVVVVVVAEPSLESSPRMQRRRRSFRIDILFETTKAWQ